MAFIIPWIFRAGTKAKSAEVNENFLAVKQFVDLLEEDTATNQQNIEILENTKAGINGDATQRFQVANAIVDKDAVNKAMYDEWSINAKGYIDGFNLFYTSSSITASAGTCWSYNYELGEYEYIIITQALTETTSSLAANTTYYIFVCADSSGINSPELTYTTNRDNPNYPVGLNISRRIGSFKTNSSSQIKEVLKEGDQVIPQRVGFITSYLGEITAFKGQTKDYTAEQDMYLSIVCTMGGFFEVSVYIKIQGAWRLIDRAARSFDGTGDNGYGGILIPIKEGQKYRIQEHNLGTDYKIYKYGMGG